VQFTARQSVEKLKNLNRLTTLSLGWNDVVSVSPFKNLIGLVSLELTGCKNLKDDGIIDLKNLVNLMDLSLAYTGITDKALVIVKVLTKLFKLSLQGCDVTDKGLMNLYNMPILQYLTLDPCPKVTKKEVENLKNRLKNLRVY